MILQIEKNKLNRNEKVFVTSTIKPTLKGFESVHDVNVDSPSVRKRKLGGTLRVKRKN